MDVRVSRAAAVVVQRVPPAAADWFLNGQRGIRTAAAEFPGYRGTDVYPAANGRGNEWVVVMHFDDEQNLHGWLDSAVRAQWVKQLRSHVGNFELRAFPGFGPWFANLARSASAPPTWKMALTVLLGLYPTIMVLTIFPGWYTSRLGYAVSILIGNALSVSILQWVVMPVLSRWLAPWLQAGPEARARTMWGVVLILVLLAAMTTLFTVTGVRP